MQLLDADRSRGAEADVCLLGEPLSLPLEVGDYSPGWRGRRVREAAIQDVGKSLDAAPLARDRPVSHEKVLNGARGQGGNRNLVGPNDVCPGCGVARR